MIALTRDILGFHSLSRDVLAVAVRYDGCRGPGWKAMIGAVPGKSHPAEAEQVADYGTAVLEPVARELFPGLADRPYYV